MTPAPVPPGGEPQNPFDDENDEDRHMAWSLGCAEGKRFAAGRAAATPDPPDARLDAVYAERNAVVLGLAKAGLMLGWRVGKASDPNEPDWPVVYIDTPAGQVSWHFRAADVPDWVEPYPGEWDRHSDAEKYERLSRLPVTPADSPDERLREALRDLAEAARPYVERAAPDEKLWDEQDYRNFLRLSAALAAAVDPELVLVARHRLPAALAAADREAPSVSPEPDEDAEGECPPAATPDPPRTVLDPETGIEEPVTTGRIPDAEFVEPPLMPPAASPDERLREAAAEALAAMESITPMALQRTKPERVEAHARWKDAHANLVAALAYGPYTPAEEGLPDPGPCADHAFLDGPDNPFAPHDSGHAIWRAGFNAGLVEQSRVIEREDA